MTLFELKQYLEQGREIEFSLFSNSYFLYPLFENEKFTNSFAIHDSLLGNDIVLGNLEAILSFEFAPGISFIKKIDYFKFEYIL